jgi:hypothetical protein
MLSMMIQDTEEIAKFPMAISMALVMLLIWSVMEAVTSYSDVQQKINSRVYGVGGAVIVDDMNGYLQIGSMVFNLPYETLLRIKPLEPHIVYYLPKWNQVLSIEVVKH